MTHLDSLQLRLSNERMRFSEARTQRERDLRTVWVAQIEREIAAEMDFLGMPKESADMSDTDLLAALKL